MARTNETISRAVAAENERKRARRAALRALEVDPASEAGETARARQRISEARERAARRQRGE